MGQYDLATFQRHYRLAVLTCVAGLVGWLVSAEISAAIVRERRLMEAVSSSMGLQRSP